MARLTVAQLMAAYDEGMGSPEGPLHYVESVVRAEVWWEAAEACDTMRGVWRRSGELREASAAVGLAMEFRARAEQEVPRGQA
jgi:hypothetical protein